MAYDLSLMNRRPGPGVPSSDVTKPLFVGGSNVGGAPGSGSPGGAGQNPMGMATGGGAADMLKSLEMINTLKKLMEAKQGGGGGMGGGMKGGAQGGNAGLAQEGASGIGMAGGGM